MPTYYQTLGVARDAEAEVIAAAYKALVRKYHPDKNHCDEAQRRTRELNQAYSVLRCPEQRKNYDETLETRRAEHFAARQDSRASVHGSDHLGPKVEASDADGSAPAKPRIALLVILAFAVLSLAVALSSGLFKSNKLDSASADSDMRSAFQHSDETDPTFASVDLDNGAAGQQDLASDSDHAPGTAPTDDNQQPVPTLGQFNEKLTLAMQKFVEIEQKRGTSGIHNYSVACNKAARYSNDILDTDFCVAFDMAAITSDVATSNQTGQPMDDYLVGRTKEIDEDYKRFPQATSKRAAIIWNEVQERLPTVMQTG